MEKNSESTLPFIKTLFLIEHLLRSGSSNFVDSIRSEMSRLKYLTSFSFYDEKRIDKGETSIKLLKVSQRKVKVYHSFTRR